MRRPKGIKTKKSVAKRFKITATGKVMRFRAGRRHLAQPKTPSAAAASARSPSWIQPTPIASPKTCRSAI
jgi:ribosomal protein L35